MSTETTEVPNLAEQLTECLEVLAEHVDRYSSGALVTADGSQTALDQLAADPVFTAMWQVCELVQTLLAEHLEVTTLLSVAIERERSRQAVNSIITATKADLEALKAPLGKVKA